MARNEGWRSLAAPEVSFHWRNHLGGRRSSKYCHSKAPPFEIGKASEIPQQYTADLSRHSYQPGSPSPWSLLARPRLISLPEHVNSSAWKQLILCARRLQVRRSSHLVVLLESDASHSIQEVRLSGACSGITHRDGCHGWSPRNGFPWTGMRLLAGALSSRWKARR